MGFSFYVDLHIVVDGDITVRQGHKIAHEVEDKVMKGLPQIARSTRACRAARRADWEILIEPTTLSKCVNDHNCLRRCDNSVATKVLSWCATWEP